MSRGKRPPAGRKRAEEGGCACGGVWGVCGEGVAGMTGAGVPFLAWARAQGSRGGYLGASMRAALGWAAFRFERVPSVLKRASFWAP